MYPHSFLYIGVRPPHPQFTLFPLILCKLTEHLSSKISVYRPAGFIMVINLPEHSRLVVCFVHSLNFYGEMLIELKNTYIINSCGRKEQCEHMHNSSFILIIQIVKYILKIAHLQNIKNNKTV